MWHQEEIEFIVNIHNTASLRRKKIINLSKKKKDATHRSIFLQELSRPQFLKTILKNIFSLNTIQHKIVTFWYKGVPAEITSETEQNGLSSGQFLQGEEASLICDGIIFQSLAPLYSIDLISYWNVFFLSRNIGHHVMPISCYNYAPESISQNNGENVLVQVYFDNHIQKLVTEADECHQF